MEKLSMALQRFMREEDGVTAIEYGLIAALIAVVIITSVTAVGDNLDAVFNYIAGQLDNALP
ncbi:Flp family type IVb pilin [Pseudogulbenkiania sp. MAI-1]|uniref:Flp family type IVb pilin n=1 Tax=Pseudogulbenkiania sp. MAI-1 TaxID=990370 RepID=UPI00045EBC4F|nr:Flp family type IVb pilin [Pseudogulbenkiania sp. MAI-1]